MTIRELLKGKNNRKGCYLKRPDFFFVKLTGYGINHLFRSICINYLNNLWTDN